MCSAWIQIRFGDKSILSEVVLDGTALVNKQKSPLSDWQLGRKTLLTNVRPPNVYGVSFQHFFCLEKGIMLFHHFTINDN